MEYNIEYYHDAAKTNRKVSVRENAMGRVIETIENVTSETVDKVIDDLKKKYKDSCLVEFYY